MDNFTIVSENVTHSKKYQCTQTSFNIVFKNIHNKSFLESYNYIVEMFQAIVEKFMPDLNIQDKIRVVFDHDLLEYPVSIPFVNRDKFTAENLLNVFELAFQSYKTINITEDKLFKCSVIIAKNPTGGSRLIFGSVDEFILKS